MTGSYCSQRSALFYILFVIVFLLSTDGDAKTFSFDEHDIDLGIRPRLAYIDAPAHAKSASILFRFRAESEWSDAFSTLVEADYVHLEFEDDFTNGVNFNNRPVIPDVKGIDLNQLYLKYAFSNAGDLIIGREVLNIGNERFIGSNGFWQNEQSLDIAGFDYKFKTASSFLYRYVTNVNRINGEKATTRLSPSDPIFDANNGRRPANFLGDHSHITHLLFIEVKESEHSAIQAYYYDMDIDEAALLSNRTVGVRYDYRGRWGRYKTASHAEFARQKRPELNSSKYHNYFNIGLGVGFKTRDYSLQYEVLEGNNGASFVTPLASLHDQNGWADKFLATPAGGLRDLSGKLVWRISPIKFDVRYHVFSSDSTSNSIGKELDIDLSFKVSHNNSLLIRFADFDSDSPEFESEQRVFIQYFYNL